LIQALNIKEATPFMHALLPFLAIRNKGKSKINKNESPVSQHKFTATLILNKLKTPSSSSQTNLNYELSI
jgi:hypothetical protein